MSCILLFQKVKNVFVIAPHGLAMLIILTYEYFVYFCEDFVCM